MKMLNKILLIICLFLMVSAAGWASGTGAGQKIVAPSTNLLVLYTDEYSQSITRLSSEFGIPDGEQTITEINGLLQTGVGTSEIDSFYNAGTYRGIKGGVAGAIRKYVLTFQYMNRGNTTEEVIVTSSLTAGDNRWWTEDPATKNLLEDEIQTYTITLNVQNPIALEDVVMNTLAKLITANHVVSYNAFSGAVGYYDGGFQANIQNIFSFEAEGATLEYLSKTVTIVAPASYGSPADAAVPGSKIKLTTMVKNTSTAVATGVRLRDKVANNCHFYPTDTPVLSGAAYNSNHFWATGSDNNMGPGSSIGWDDITISPNATVTVEYTFTID